MDGDGKRCGGVDIYRTSESMWLGSSPIHIYLIIAMLNGECFGCLRLAEWEVSVTILLDH